MDAYSPGATGAGAARRRARQGVWRRGAAALLLACALSRGGGAQARDEWRTDFSCHTVPLEQIVPGGPPKDGILAIDRPRVEPVRSAARWLKAREPVMVVEHAGRARAYPLRILIWHEIVNDRIGDLPLAVTYCPLCNTALVFDRRHGGRVLDFGTTGRVRHSDLVMYDRQTESWWQQATGAAIVGALSGDTLRRVPSQVLSWAEFRSAHPAGEVLSQTTGYERPYGTNPYAGYDDPGGSPIAAFFGGRRDDRLPPMERVVAVRLGAATVAYPFSRLRAVRVAHDVLGERPVVVFWAPGTASALDRGVLADGRDVGATGVFVREMDGRRLSFDAAGDGRFRDRETGSTWDLLGRALAGPLRGRRLAAVAAGDYFWFAWAVFRPETRVWRNRSFAKGPVPDLGRSPVLLGYARVSRGDEQTSALQRRALAEAGVERVFDEAASGGRWDRPVLHRLLDQLRPGDVVVVWKLDRLSRSLKDLLAILERVDAAGAGFRSLIEAVDTTVPAGRSPSSAGRRNSVVRR